MFSQFIVSHKKSEEKWGKKIQVSLSNANTRSFSFIITETLFIHSLIVQLSRRGGDFLLFSTDSN